MVLLGQGGQACCGPSGSQGPCEGGVGLWWPCPTRYAVFGPRARGTQSGWEMGNRPRDSRLVPEPHRNPGSGRGHGDQSVLRPPDPGSPVEESGRPFCLPPPAEQPGHRTPPSPPLPLLRSAGWGSNLGLNPESTTPPGKVPQHTSPSWTCRAGVPERVRGPLLAHD